MKYFLLFIAFLWFILWFILVYNSHIHNSKECNENKLRSEGCRETVNTLHSDGKLSDFYHRDALQWCRDRFERIDP